MWNDLLQVDGHLFPHIVTEVTDQTTAKTEHCGVIVFPRESVDQVPDEVVDQWRDAAFHSDQ